VAVTVETAISFHCKSTKRLQLKQKIASKPKPSLLLLVAIEAIRPLIEINNHCSGA